jgi:hypothetical protein
MVKLDYEPNRPKRQLDVFEWLGVLTPVAIVGGASVVAAAASIFWALQASASPTRDQPELLVVASTAGFTSVVGMIYCFVLIRRRRLRNGK